MEPIKMDYHLDIYPLKSDNAKDGEVELRVAIVNTANNIWAANRAFVLKNEFEESQTNCLFMTVLGGNRIIKSEAVELWPKLNAAYRWID